MKRRDFSLQPGRCAAAPACRWPPARRRRAARWRARTTRAGTAAAGAAPAGKIEVVEFFCYGCPHCNAFEPTLDAWAKKLPADVVFRRVPVALHCAVRDLPADLLRARGDGPAGADAPQGVRRHPRAAPAPGQGSDIVAFMPANGVDGAKFMRALQVLLGADQGEPGAPAAARPTGSTACRRWASRAASSRRRRWPAATNGRWQVTDNLIAEGAQGRADRVARRARGSRRSRGHCAADLRACPAARRLRLEWSASFVPHAHPLAPHPPPCPLPGASLRWPLRWPGAAGPRPRRPTATSR